MKKKVSLTVIILSITAIIAVVNVNLAKIDSSSNSLTLRNIEAMAITEGSVLEFYRKIIGNWTLLMTYDNKYVKGSLTYDIIKKNGVSVKTNFRCKVSVTGLCEYSVGLSFHF
jgi:hypothetical protein